MTLYYLHEHTAADYRRLAARAGMTLSEWVRQGLRRAGREEPSGRLDRKLAAVRAAASHEFPTADVDRMLAEIESGHRL